MQLIIGSVNNKNSNKIKIKIIKISNNNTTGNEFLKQLFSMVIDIVQLSHPYINPLPKSSLFWYNEKCTMGQPSTLTKNEVSSCICIMKK